MRRNLEILRAPEGEAGGAPPAVAPPAGGPPAAAPPAGGDGGQGGGAAKPWFDTIEGLDPEDRVFLASRNPPDLKTAIRSFKDMERMARDRNVLPKPDPTKMGEWSGWAELGWKEDATEYAKGLKRPQMPADLAYNADFEQKLVKIAHENKMPVAAAQAVLDGVTQYFVDSVNAVDASGAKALKDLETKLRTDWGKDYEANMELSKRAAKHFGVGLDDLSELDKIVGNARVMQIFQQIGAAMGEDKLVDSGRGGGSAQLSASQVQAELDRQAADKDFMDAFTNPGHPRHREVRQQRDELISRKAKLAA